MKKSIILFILLTSFFTACASNNIEAYDDDFSSDYENETIIQPEMTDSFLGDFDPIEMDSLMFLQKSKNEVKPKEINNIHLIPRTNNVEFYFRDGINMISLIFSKEEREKIIEACNTFLTQYEEKNVPHHKVNSKTAYVKSTCSMWFGIVSTGNGCNNAEYYVNCEFINKQPYLIISFIPTRCGESSKFTPKFSLYMSPSQIREFISEMNQENLNKLLTTLQEKAYTY